MLVSFVSLLNDAFPYPEQVGLDVCSGFWRPPFVAQFVEQRGEVCTGVLEEQTPGAIRLISLQDKVIFIPTCYQESCPRLL